MKLNTKLNLTLLVPPLLACAAVLGGCGSANKKPGAAKASTALPPLSQAAAPVAPPAPPAAPAVAFTPAAPAQPVVYDPPADPPVVEQPAVEALDDAPPAAPVARSRPRKTASAASGTRYKVKKGESLWSIAQAKYGNGNKWKQIAAANPKIDPNRVQAGQTITLP